MPLPETRYAHTANAGLCIMATHARTTTSQKCAAVPRRARICVSLNSRLESNKEEGGEETANAGLCVMTTL